MDIYSSEKDVETKFIQNLFSSTLGYPGKSLRWNYPVKMTLGKEKKTKYADLVIFHDKKPVIVVEAKKPTEALQTGINQVDSYAFVLQTPYSVITNGLSFILRGYYSFNSRMNVVENSIDELKRNNWEQIRKLISFTDITSSTTEKSNIVSAPNQEKIKDFRRFFRNIHNIIRDLDKLDPSASFDELSKILFLKAAEEEWLLKNDGNSILSINKIEEFNKIESGLDYVNRWFQSATKTFFPDVFDDGAKINLKIETLIEVLKRMQNFKVKNGDVDVKGRAFEEFLPTQLRGKGLGQYFTPRPIVNFMVDLAEISIYDIIVDFSCGSGGFLIKAFERMQKLIELLPNGTWKRLGVNKNDFLEDIKVNHIHGIDAEPRAARTAKMNMLMWGDGKSIARGNALDLKDSNGKNYIPQEYSSHIKDSGCSIILANPPFGGKEKNQKILSNYYLGSKKNKRNKQKTEILFLEKGIKLLKPEGKMLIVLPIGIISNESYQYVRDFINSEAEIRGIFTLPTHTFVQSGVDTINTCIIYLQKFTTEKKEIYDNKMIGLTPEEIRKKLKEDKDFNYSIFMGIAEFVGFEPSGRPNLLQNEKTDLDLLHEDFFNKTNIKIPEINMIDFANEHYEEKRIYKNDYIVRGTNKNLKTSFHFDFKDIDFRYDPSYLLFKYNSEKLLLNYEPIKNGIKEINERFLPVLDEEMDKEYQILSVTNTEGIIFNEFRKGEEFTQPYKKVQSGDIVYNPYRINVGSIGVVPKELNNGYVSPAYVVFRSISYNAEFLVELLKSPFYKMYIDLISTGSIRDSLSFDLLETIKIPKINKKKQDSINNFILKSKKKINKHNINIAINKEEITSELHKLIVNI